jgi:hypothetical protein
MPLLGTTCRNESPVTLTGYGVFSFYTLAHGTAIQGAPF